jgi:signal transduction histidine kinase
MLLSGLLLLLLPTLAAALGAGWLLYREQQHINAQARETAAARESAMAARTKLVAENIETLVVDVQNGLMKTLKDTPAANPVPFLNDWRESNPLVRDVFQTNAAGTVRWGRTDSTGADWLVTAPWQHNETTTPIAQKEGHQAPQFFYNSNAQSYQSNREQVQELSVQNTVPLSEKGIRSRVNKMAAPSFPERTDWQSWKDAAGTWHLFGWRVCDEDNVLVVEANLHELARNLNAALPVQTEADETYDLCLDNVPVSQTKKTAPSRGTRTSIVPVSAKLLPNWTVRGYWSPSAYATDFQGGKFFTASLVLVALFITTILSGGFLLLQQARRSEAESAQKTSFVANVSHEFKTPLTTIRLYAELLEQGRVRDDARAECLKTISSETQRLARLVNNVLDFSRLEQGRKKFDLRPLDLTALLRSLLERFTPRLQDAGMRLEQHLPTAPLLLETDADAVEQIALNLLENACKYAASGGEVTVALTPKNTATTVGADLRIGDRGAGIPASQRERIFEKFYRVDNTLTASSNGAGLGLSIARQLARGLGGDLRCVARNGGGCEFVLTLPVRNISLV